MISSIPTSAKFGCAVGLLGGFASMVAMALFFVPEKDALITMGLYMIGAVLFFAIAGGFSNYAQWSWKVLVFMIFMTLGITVTCTAVEYIDVSYSVASIILLAVLLLTAYNSNVKEWLTFRN